MKNLFYLLATVLVFACASKNQPPENKENPDSQEGIKAQESLEEEQSSSMSTNSVDQAVSATGDSYKVTFPLNEYITTDGITPYPIVNTTKLSEIDTTKLTPVEQYGAKGDGKTLDDNALLSAMRNSAYGVKFQRGKTYLVGKHVEVMLTHDLVVWAYGATIKMGDFKRYSWCTFRTADRSGSYKYKLLWLGGTIDGNQQKQNYPSGPNQQTWVEPGGGFVIFQYFDFILVKDVTVANTVVSGFISDATRVSMFTDSKGLNGAGISYYNTAKRQGGYWKVTRNYYKTAYFNNLQSDDGSTGVMVNWAGADVFDTATQVIFNNCRFYNTAQDNIHIEDADKVFMYKCDLGGDMASNHNLKVHVSGRSRYISVKNCNFKNLRFLFATSGSKKMAIVDSSTFVSTQQGVWFFINNCFNVINSTFTGTTQQRYQISTKYTKNCSFNDFSTNKAITVLGSNGVVTESRFTNGCCPITTTSGTLLFNNTYINVTNPNANKNPTNTDWQKAFAGYINIVDQNGRFLGRINTQ